MMGCYSVVPLWMLSGSVDAHLVGGNHHGADQVCQCQALRHGLNSIMHTHTTQLSACEPDVSINSNTSMNALHKG